MRFSARLEVHFHDQGLGSVVVHTTGELDLGFGETLLFVLFALRQLSNLGSVGPGPSLADVLTRLPGNLTSLAQHDHPDTPKLVPHPGTPGRRRFLCKLSYENERCVFILKPRGFGLLSRGVGYYAPNSVILLARYFASKYEAQPQRVAQIEAAASRVGLTFRSGEVTPRNQTRLAVAIAAMACRDVGERTSKYVEPSEELPRGFVPVSRDGDRLSVPASVQALLTSAATTITQQDLEQLFSPGGHSIRFGSLDTATRSVFEDLVTIQVDVFHDNFPTAVPVDDRALRQEIGSCVMEGYILGRRIARTWLDQISRSLQEGDGMPVAEKIRRTFVAMPGNVLENAGEVVSRFAYVWSVYHSERGLYAAVQPRDVAAMSLYLCLMDGFRLAIAEHHVLGHQD